MANDQYILAHYKKIAKTYGSSKYSSMQDTFVRDTELIFFKTEVEEYLKNFSSAKILDLGCGNGYTIEYLQKHFPQCEYTGVEFTPELLEIAQNRKLTNCSFLSGDIRFLTLSHSQYDIVITQRVIINLLSQKQQECAYQQIFKVLKPNGKYLFSESFKSSLIELNKARDEFDLEKIEQSKHNLFLKDSALNYLEKIGLKREETLMPSNYLSTHFYTSRVVHASINTDNGKIKNSRFVQFFDQALPPAIGNYSPIRFYKFIALNSAQEKDIF